MNGQFQIAMHILTLLNTADGKLLASDYIAGSININPALVRKEIRNLRTYGLVDSKEGKAGGYTLGKPADQIKLGDVYRAVKYQSALGEAKNKPNPSCIVGRQINQHLNTIADEVDAAIIKKLDAINLESFSELFK